MFKIYNYPKSLKEELVQLVSTCEKFGLQILTELESIRDQVKGEPPSWGEADARGDWEQKRSDILGNVFYSRFEDEKRTLYTFSKNQLFCGILTGDVQLCIFFDNNSIFMTKHGIFKSLLKLSKSFLRKNRKIAKYGSVSKMIFDLLSLDYFID